MRAVSLIFFIIIIGITTIITTSNAWLAIGNYHHEENPGKCTINETMILDPGESMMSSESCMEIYCADDLGNVSVFSCSEDITVPGCTWSEPIDSQADYPDCCRRNLECENEDIEDSLDESGTFDVEVLEFLENNGDSEEEKEVGNEEKD